MTVNVRPDSGNDVVLYLVGNGVHTDIVVPTKTARIDWSKVAPPSDTIDKIQRPYLVFGWTAFSAPIFWKHQLSDSGTLNVLGQ